MDYNDINRYRKQAIETKRQIESYKNHYTFEHEYFDHPDTMDNTPATILYVFVMIGGAIFYDRLLIWFFATVVYFCHIGRHKIGRNKNN